MNQTVLPRDPPPEGPIPPQDVDDTGDQTNPFVGPHALSENDDLFGRTLEVRMLRDLVIAERVVLLYSPSGAGKTSLLHAGLKRELIDDGFAVLPTVRVTHEAPEALAGMPIRNRYSLSTLLSLEAGREHELDPAALAEITLDQYLERTREARAAVGHDCLFFDQFEELFTADPIDVDAKRDFLGELGDALRNRSRWAIISMREDFAAHLDPYLKLFPTRLRATFRLDLLGPQAAKAAILGPMSASDVSFDDAAATALVDDLRTIRVQRGAEAVDQPGLTVEPVQLQVVCRRLWALLGGAHEITAEHMTELGNVDHALRDFYDDVASEVVGVTGVPERVLRTWISDELVTEQGYRAQVQHGPQGDVAGAVLPALENAHLVRADRRRSTVWYELAHDRLVDPIRHSNDEWLARNLSELQRGARTWEEQRRSDRALFVGDELRAVEEWATAHPDQVSEREAEFLAACREEQERLDKDARTSRRTRILAIAMTAVAAVAIVALVASFIQWRQVERQKDNAEAVEASSAYFFGAQSHEVDYDIRSRLLLDEMALDALPESEDPSAFILRGINTDRFERYLTVIEQTEGSAATTGATAMSADGGTVGVVTADGVRVIDLDGLLPDRVVPVEVDAELLLGEALAISSDGSRLAFLPADGGPIQLWHVGDETMVPLEPATPLEAFTGTRLAFVDDDRLLVAIGDPAASVFDVAAGTDVTPASLAELQLFGGRASESGMVAALDTEGVLHLIDATTGVERSTIFVDVGDVMAIDATGDQVVVTDYETMTVHDTVTGEPTELASLPLELVAAFDAEGSLLTFAPCVMHRWAFGSDTPVAETRLPTCLENLERVTLSADAGRLHLHGWEGQWSAISLDDDDVLESSASGEGAVAAGGTIVARVEGDRVVVRTPEGDLQAETRPGDGAFQRVAVDPVGQAVVAASDERLATIDPATGEITATAELPWTPAWLAVGGQGTVVAAASDDGEIVRWYPALRDGATALASPTASDPIDVVTALAVTGRSGSVVVASHDQLIVHTDRAATLLAAGLGEITQLATAGSTDAVVAIVRNVGPADDVDLLGGVLHLWPDGRLASRSGELELPQLPDAVALSGRHVFVGTGITSDVYNARAIVSNKSGGTTVPVLAGGHNDLSSYYGIPGFAVDEVAIDESGAVPRFLWVPVSGPSFELLLDDAALLADIRETAEADGFPPLTDEECQAAADLGCR